MKKFLSRISQPLHPDIDLVLKKWRIKTIQFILALVPIVTLPSLIVLLVYNAIPDPSQRPAAIAFAVLYLVVIALFVFKHIDYRFKGGVLLLLLYVAGLIALVRGGLAGVGREYMLALPLLGLILLGQWTGLALLVVSIATIIGFGFIADSGWLSTLLIYSNNPTDLRVWMVEGIYSVTVIVLVGLLFIIFYQFQLRTIRQERKSAEALQVARDELFEINQNLEAIVRDRTSKLEEALEQSRQSQQKAEDANRAKTNLMAAVSHEIRTPMNGILGIIGVLESTQLAPKQREYVELIHSSSETMLATLNDILEISKNESGKFRITKASFDFLQCVEDEIELWGGRALSKGLDLGYSVDLDVPTRLNSDSTRIKQVLGNLLSNAVKFTNNGSVILNVSTEGWEKFSDKIKKPRLEEVLIHIRVKDTGIGIDPDRIQYLFTPFVQADSSISRKFGGTGLGLTIVRQLCEGMGGLVWAESDGASGQGSEFHVLLPLEPVGTENFEERLNNYSRQLHGTNIAWISQNVFMANALKRISSAVPVGTTVFNSVEDVESWVEANTNLDILFIDQDMDSPGYLEVIRAVKNLAHQLILICRPMKTIPKDALQNLNGVIERPVHLTRLLNLCSTLITQETTEDVSKNVMDSTLAARYPLRILVVEDNPVNQQVVILLLEQLGYKPILAGNGNQALQTIQADIPDIILMDYQLPDMNGLTLINSIKAFCSRQRPFLVALTALSQEWLEENNILVEVDAVLYKPLRKSEMVEILISGYQKLFSRTKNIPPDQKSSTDLPSESPIDMNVFRGVWDPELRDKMGKFLEILMAETNSQIGEMEKAIQVQDKTRISFLGHTLKGSLRTVGASSVANLCERAEMNPGEFIMNPVLIIDLKNEIKLAINELHNLKKTGW